MITEVADFYGSSPANGGTGAKWEVSLCIARSTACSNYNGLCAQTFRDLMESEDLLEEDMGDEEPPNEANDAVSTELTNCL